MGRPVYLVLIDAKDVSERGETRGWVNVRLGASAGID